MLRYKTDETDDGLSGKEGTFLICSFWLVSALAVVGELQQARDLMERLLRVGSPLGLFAEDERYRVVWEFGIGLNTEVVPQPGNCGMNEVAGGGDGTLHLGFGLTPATAYALTFGCQGTELLDDRGRHLCGGKPVRRLLRRRSADCGCH